MPNLGEESMGSTTIPLSGWTLHDLRKRYALDVATGDHGASRLTLSAAAPLAESAWATSMALADARRGTRLRVSATVALHQVTGRAGLGVLVRGVNGDQLSYVGPVVAFDVPRGTMAPHAEEYVIDIPQDAHEVVFAIELMGTGSVWIQDLRWEEVDASTPVTDLGRELPSRPHHLDFAPLTPVGPTGWALSDSRIGCSQSGPHVFTLDLPSNVGRAMLLQYVRAGAYRGMTLRLAAELRGTGAREASLMLGQTPLNVAALRPELQRLESVRTPFDWTSLQIVAVVAGDSEYLQYGVSLWGPSPGTLDVRNLTVLTAAAE
jgi:hypothetical protein